MSRKAIITIVAGLLLLAVTAVIFNAVYNTYAVSEAEFFAASSREAVAEIVDRSQQAGMVRNVFFFAAALEVIVTGVLAYQWRND